MQPLTQFQELEKYSQPIENLKAYLQHTIEIHRYPEVYLK
jgi:hypothetical protein